MEIINTYKKLKTMKKLSLAQFKESKAVLSNDILNNIVGGTDSKKSKTDSNLSTDPSQYDGSISLSLEANNGVEKTDINLLNL